MNPCINSFCWKKKCAITWLMLTNVLHMVLHDREFRSGRFVGSPVIGPIVRSSVWLRRWGTAGEPVLYFALMHNTHVLRTKNNTQEMTYISCGAIFSCTINKGLDWLCPQEIQRTRIRPTRTWMGHLSRIYGHQTDLFDDQFNWKILHPWLPIFFHGFMI